MINDNNLTVNKKNKRKSSQNISSEQANSVLSQKAVLQSNHSLNVRLNGLKKQRNS
jgi:hypothetical protein